MKANQAVDMFAILAGQMARSNEDKKGHRADKRESREAAIKKQIDSVEKNYEAAQKQIATDIAKCVVQIVAAPIGIVGAVGGGIAGIVIDQTMAEEAAQLRAQAGLIDVAKERLNGLADDQKSREDEERKRAARAYDAGIRISETILNNSKIA